MDIEDLRCVAVLGKMQNFGKAAAELNLTQPALTRRIQNIEKEAGCALFVRSTRAMSFTPAGEVFFEGALDIMRRYDCLMERTKEASARRRTPVVVGGNLSNWMIVSTVEKAIAFTRTHNLEIELVPKRELTSRITSELGRFEPDALLAEGELDVAVLFAGEQLKELDFVVQELYRDPFAVYVSPSSAERLGTSLELSDLAGELFVEPVIYATYMNRILSLCRAKGFEPECSLRYAESLGDLGRFRDDREVVIVPESVSSYIGPSEISGLVRVRLSDPDAFFDVVAARRKSDERPEVLCAMDVFRRLHEVIAKSSSS